MSGTTVDNGVVDVSDLLLRDATLALAAEAPFTGECRLERPLAK